MERRSAGLPNQPTTHGGAGPSYPAHSVQGAPAIDSKQLAAAAAYLADLKKGGEIRVVDVSQQLRVADWFVIVTGLSRPHVKAITNEIHVRLKAAGERHQPIEGGDLGWWVLLDYGDVVVHVFQPEARDYYGLDSLYGECPELDWRAVELPDLPEAERARA